MKLDMHWHRVNEAFDGFATANQGRRFMCA